MYKLQSINKGKGVMYFTTQAKAPKIGDIFPLTHRTLDGDAVTEDWQVVSVYPTGEHWAGIKVEAELMK